MANRVSQPEFRAALRTFLEEREGRARYERAQRAATSGGTATRPRPLEFDERGFPLPQGHPTFVTRVARLRNPL
jgi:hypothetical protein